MKAYTKQETIKEGMESQYTSIKILVLKSEMI